MSDTRLRPAHLPEYLNPPLDEIAFGVQFNELTRWQSVHFGMIYDEFSSQFPNVQEQDLIVPKFETFGRSLEAGISTHQISFRNRPPLPRVWFVSEDGHELIQIQTTRFVRNWRKVDGYGQYKRFDNLLPEFLDEYRRFLHRVERMDVGAVVVNQCELSYFNVVTVPKESTYQKAFCDIFNNWSQLKIDSLGRRCALEEEAGSFDLRYLIKDDAGEPVGRLYVEARPALRNKDERIIRFAIIARGIPRSNEVNGIEEFMRLGREVIVSTFASITSNEIQSQWKLVS